MAHVEIYSKSWCGYCRRAKTLLDAKGVTYTDTDATTDRNKELEMIQRSGSYTVPQIFIDSQHIGGHDDLFALETKGDLDRLLKRFANPGETIVTWRSTRGRQDALNEDDEPDLGGVTY